MSLIHEKSAHEFEKFLDLESALCFIAGCAIRERRARIKEQEGTLADDLNTDEEALIRDACKVIALCEASSQEDMQSKLEAAMSWADNLK